MAIRKTTEEVLSIRVEGTQRARKEYDEVARSQDRLERETRQTDEAIKRQGKSMGRATGMIQTASHAAQLFSITLHAVRRAMDALRAPAGLAIDFEKNFAQIKTLSSDVTESVRQDLLGLAARLPSSAADVTKAAYQAVSAGIKVPDLVGFLEAASRVAVGGATDMTSAVNLLTSATNAWANQGMTATDAADSFFTAVRLGKTTIEELNSVLGRGASLSQFGISLDELNASIATLTVQGVPTAEAMTKMTALVKLIAQPTAQARKRFKFLGVEVGAARLQAVGLSGVLKDLQTATMGSTQILGTMGRRMEANAALLGLLGNNYGAFNRTLGEFEEKAGAAAAANEIMKNTTQGAIDQFNALREDVLRRMGEKMLPHVNALLEDMVLWLTAHGDELVNTVGEAAKSVIEFGRWIAANKDAVMTGITAMFSTLAITGFVNSLVAMRASFTASMATMAAQGGTSFLGRLGAGIAAGARGGPWLAALVGVFTVVGMILGKSMGESAAERAGKELEKIKEQQAALSRDMEQRRRLGGYGVTGMEGVRKQVLAGDRFYFATRPAAFGDRSAMGPGATPALKPSRLVQEERATLPDEWMTMQRGRMIERESPGRGRRPVRLPTPYVSEPGVMPPKAQLTTVKDRLQQWIDQITNSPAFQKWRTDTLDGLKQLPTQIKRGNQIVEVTQKREMTLLERQRAVFEKAAARLAKEVGYEVKARQAFMAGGANPLKGMLDKLMAVREAQKEALHQLTKRSDVTSDEFKETEKEIKGYIKATEAQMGAVSNYMSAMRKSTKSMAGDFATTVDDERDRFNAAAREAAGKEKTRLKKRKLEKAWKSQLDPDSGKASDKAAKLAAKQAAERERFIESQRKRREAASAKVKDGKLADPETQRTQAQAAREAEAQRQFEKLQGKAAERQVARAEMDDANRAEQLAQRLDYEKRKGEAVTAYRLELANAEAGITGSAADAQIIQMSQQFETQRQMYEQYNISITDLSKAHAEQRTRLANAEAAAIKTAISMSQASVVQSIGSSLGAIKQVAEAADASAAVMGVVEAAQIAAMGVYHGFMSASEFAKATSAAAMALPPGPQSPVFIAKATAHKAAGVMHAIQAGAAAVQAGMALHGGFTAGGGGGGGGLAPDYQQPAGTTRLADREAASEGGASIQFGDIVLSDVPAFFSNEGIDALGERLTQTLIEQLNRQSAIPGGARMSERSFRHRRS